MPKIVGGSLAEHRGRVRERLFASLRALLDQRGYDEITLADIAAGAGVGRTAMYNHFPDKESVLLALAVADTDDYLARLSDSLAVVENPVDRLAVYITAQITELAGYHRHMAGLGAALSDSARKQIRDHVRPMVQRLRGILAEVIVQGYAPEQDLDELVPLVLAATTGARIAGLRQDGLQRAIDTSVVFVRQGIGVQCAADGRPRTLPSSHA